MIKSFLPWDLGRSEWGPIVPPEEDPQMIDVDSQMKSDKGTNNQHEL